MIVFTKKRHGLAVQQVFFCEKVLPAPKGVDILQVVQAKTAFQGCVTFGTQIIDLVCDEEKILAGFNKAAQYDVRRMIRDGVASISVMEDQHSNLERFCEFYNAFARHKSIASIGVDGLKELFCRGEIVLAACECSGYNDFLCVHAYLNDGNRARLLYSATDVDAISRGKGQFVARSNRYLHWKMMQYFKSRGVFKYDLGGIAGDADLKGIDEFKRSLGGCYVEEFNGLIANSLKGRVALLLLSAIDLQKRCSRSWRFASGAGKKNRSHIDVTRG